MRGTEYVQLTAFLAVAERRSFVKAASQIGMAPSTLSQTIAALEERLGVRLFNRTTRSVAPTPAGEELLAQLRPALEAFDAAQNAMDRFRDRTMGNLRLVMSRAAGLSVVAPLAAGFMTQFPDIHLELIIDDAITDIVREGFDAGIRIGHLVERDMNSLALSKELPMRLVAAPALLAQHCSPKTPKDLQHLPCIRTCHPVSGTPFRWSFARGGKRLELVPGGPLTVNDDRLALLAALDGAGIAYQFEREVASYLAEGRLVSLLENWSVALPAFHLFYPRNRHLPAPLQALIDYLSKAVTL
jgi:DNA-binding transcriptional LysR family regulator